MYKNFNISEEERQQIMEMYQPKSSKESLSEQPVPAKPASTVGGFQVGDKQVGGVPSVDSQVKAAKAVEQSKLSCVKPEEFTVKGSVRNSFIYQDGTKQYVIYNDGAAAYYEGNNRLKTGNWSCGPQGIELRWDNNPGAVEYKPVPSKYYRKGLNIQDCAQKFDDINIGKFLFQGCQGPAVKELQTKLGMSNPTEFYGSQTRAAVVKLQQSKGLKADGVFGRDTYSVLR